VSSPSTTTNNNYGGPELISYPHGIAYAYNSYEGNNGGNVYFARKILTNSNEAGKTENRGKLLKMKIFPQ
jgi:hypothetical protein